MLGVPKRSSGRSRFGKTLDRNSTPLNSALCKKNMKFLRCKYKTLSQNGELVDLNNSDKETIKKILDTLMSSNNVLYRGVNSEYLSDRFCKNKSKFNESKVLVRLFYFGDKSQHFLNVSRNDIPPKNLKTIEDCSVETGKYIFDKFKSLAKSKNPKIIRFIKNQPIFEYFNKKNNPNRIAFSKGINNGGQLVRDYYLAILPTAGRVSIANKSLHISTSTKYKVAREFSGSSEGSYVILFIERKNISLETKEYRDSLLKQNNLPLFNENLAIFESQSEVSVRAGMYPHNILGVFNIKDKIFIANPHIFNSCNKNIDFCKTGLYINQFDFAVKIALETEYKGYSVTSDHIYYSEGSYI